MADGWWLMVDDCLLQLPATDTATTAHGLRRLRQRLQRGSTASTAASAAHGGCGHSLHLWGWVHLCLLVCAATDTRRGSRAEAALRHHRFTAGHPGPEPHHVSRPWRPAVGLWPRLIPSVASVTRDPLAGYVTSNPRGNPSWWGDTRVTLGRLVCFWSRPP